MFLYHLHDWQMAILAPWRVIAEATQGAVSCHNPFMPESMTYVGRTVAAGAELFERTTRQFTKPRFNLTHTRYRDQELEVTEDVVSTKPFCRLLHFKRHAEKEEIAKKVATDPRILVVAPLSGHHATLLRGTVEALLPEHDVYITDWLDAKQVPLSQGKFDLEDCITYIMEYIRLLGPDVHVIAVCQPAPPVLCAVALLADMDDPAQPRSMTLMGGPIDVRRAPTVVTELARTHSLEWFKNTVIQSLPFYYPGGYRLVYPGFIQLQGFMSMNAERHIDAYVKLFQNLVRGDEESVEGHRKFYDEYLSVMDVPAEFYLQTVERGFQKHDLPNGTFRWHDRLVKPEAIKRTALLTIEGELDDISAPGQTKVAHELCSNLPANMKKAHLEIGVGHYGIFNGRKWRNNIVPIIHEFVRTYRDGTGPVAVRGRDVWVDRP